MGKKGKHSIKQRSIPKGYELLDIYAIYRLLHIGMNTCGYARGIIKHEGFMLYDFFQNRINCICALTFNADGSGQKCLRTWLPHEKMETCEYHRARFPDYVPPVVPSESATEELEKELEEEVGFERAVTIEPAQTRYREPPYMQQYKPKRTFCMVLHSLEELPEGRVLCPYSNKYNAPSSPRIVLPNPLQDLSRIKVRANTKTNPEYASRNS